MACGIYKIESPSGGFYIGSSANIEHRFRQHKSELRQGIHSNGILQNAYNKYGESLVYSILVCVLDRSDLLIVEQQFIDALSPRYNISLTATCPAKTPEIAQRIAQAIRASSSHAAARKINQRKAASAVSKPVVRLTDGLMFPSAYEAARHHGIKHKDGLSTAIKNGWRFAGHFWKFAGTPMTIDEAESAWTERDSVRRENASRAASMARSRPVVRVSDGAVFTSSAAAARILGVHRTCIWEAVYNGREVLGSRWRHA